MPDDRYVMRLSVCHETYSIEEFDLQFKRNTDRDGLPEGEAYGGFVTCTLTGMPGNELLRWAAYSDSREDGEIRIYQKDQPDQQATFALRFVEGNCIRLQRKVDRISHSGSTDKHGNKVLQIAPGFWRLAQRGCGKQPSRILFGNRVHRPVYRAAYQHGSRRTCL